MFGGCDMVLGINSDVPDKVLRCFEVQGGALYWQAVEGKRTPAGERAGGAYILGRGLIVRCSRYVLIDRDIIYALRCGSWPWQDTSALPVAMVPEGAVERAREALHECCTLAGEHLVWRVARRGCVPGERLRGAALSGYRPPYVTVRGIRMLYPDALRLLKSFNRALDRARGTC